GGLVGVIEVAAALRAVVAATEHRCTLRLSGALDRRHRVGIVVTGVGRTGQVVAAATDAGPFDITAGDGDAVAIHVVSALARGLVAVELLARPRPRAGKDGARRIVAARRRNERLGDTEPGKYYQSRGHDPDSSNHVYSHPSARPRSTGRPLPQSRRDPKVNCPTPWLGSRRKHWLKIASLYLRGPRAEGRGVVAGATVDFIGLK